MDGPADLRPTDDIVGADVGEAERLLAEAGRQFHAGKLRTSAETAVRAGELARRAGRPDLQAAAALVLTGVEDPVVDTAIEGLCRDALTALGDTEVALRARLLGQLAVALHHRVRIDEAEDASARALVFAERADDPAAMAAALHARQTVIQNGLQADELLVLGGRMVQLGAATDTTERIMLGLLWQMEARIQRGETWEAGQAIDDLDVLATRTGEPLVRWHAVRARAALAQGVGRFAEAERLARLARTILQASQHGPSESLFLAQLATIYTDLGEAPPELADVWAEASGAPPIVRAGIGRLELQLGDLAAARASLEAVRPRLPELPPNQRGQPTIAAVIELAFAFGDAKLAEAMHQRFEPLDGMIMGGAIGVIGPVAYFLGRAEQAMGRLDLAIPHFEAAIAQLGPGDLAPSLARTRIALAETLVERADPGDRERAGEIASIVAIDAGRLGMRAIRVRAAAVRAALERSHARLSPREREIAAAVAAGQSNREIADALVLSERTVETHVQNILVKLGFHSRAQIAAWAVTQGITDPTT